MPPVGYKQSRALWDETRRPGASWKTLAQAILYELQPLRWQRVRQQSSQLTQWRHGVHRFCTKTLPRFLSGVPKGFMWLCTNAVHNWKALGAIVLYYYFVRFMHEILLAGPVVIIATCLVAIFTIGLGDEGDDKGRISAYSVFNRGFERLMGSIDADQLVAQHVGGGLAGAVGGNNNNGMPPIANANNNERQGRRRNQNNNGNNIDNDNGNDNNNNRARKSGKKARRRDLNQRRELQNQRQAAADLGLRENGAEDEAARNRLIEDQVAVGIEQ